jgi:ATP sulfurylase
MAAGNGLDGINYGRGCWTQAQVENMRLPSGLLFGLPIVFDTDSEDLKAGDKILLKQVSADLCAHMHD